MESILTSIKKLLGIQEEYTHFDADIIMHINSVFMILSQLGVGPEKGFMIMDSTSVWNDFLKEDPRMEVVKSYIHMRVKLLFDPPMSSAVMESMNNMIKEIEWRLTVLNDTMNEEEQDEIQ